MNIKFETVSEDYITEAVKIALDAYSEEKDSFEFLPDENYSNLFKNRIRDLFVNGSGIVAILEKK